MNSPLWISQIGYSISGLILLSLSSILVSCAEDETGPVNQQVIDTTGGGTPLDTLESGWNDSVLALPEGWSTVEPNHGKLYKAISPMSGESDTLLEWIDICLDTIPEGWHLETYCDEFIYTDRAEVDAYTLMSHKGVAGNLGGLEAERYEFTGVIDGLSVHAIEYIACENRVAVKNQPVYHITLYSTPKSIDEYRSIFDQLVRTLNISAL